MRKIAFAAALAATALIAACNKKEAASTNVASLPAPYNTADLENGKSKFLACKSCHTIKKDAPNLTGPNLHGIFGRKAGSLSNYAYSDAVKNAGFDWDFEKLDHWLQKPRDFLPGTKMTFPGFQDEKDRVDLIAYLAVESAKP
jgi:cytochrome c